MTCSSSSVPGRTQRLTVSYDRFILACHDPQYTTQYKTRNRTRIFQSRDAPSGESSPHTPMDSSDEYCYHYPPLAYLCMNIRPRTYSTSPPWSAICSRTLEADIADSVSSTLPHRDDNFVYFGNQLLRGQAASVGMRNSTRFDHGKKGWSLLAIQMETRTVVERGSRRAYYVWDLTANSYVIRKYENI